MGFYIYEVWTQGEDVPRRGLVVAADFGEAADTVNVNFIDSVGLSTISSMRLIPICDDVTEAEGMIDLNAVLNYCEIDGMGTLVGVTD